MAEDAAHLVFLVISVHCFSEDWKKAPLCAVLAKVTNEKMWPALFFQSLLVYHLEHCLHSREWKLVEDQIHT